MRIKMLLILVAGAFLIQGCAKPATSTARYTPPTIKEVKNEVQVEEDFEIVWDRLVKNLSESFYVINNIEKASRLINVSFFTESPNDFADCGHSYRTFNQGPENKTYKYNSAQSCFIKVALPPVQQGFHQYPVVANIQRETGLEGRINIYVAPNQNGGTDVSVNTRYVFNLKTEGYTSIYNQYNQVVRKDNIPANSDTCSFNTNKPGKTDIGSEGKKAILTCVSRGKLEEEILSFAKLQQ
jgi:hypothetical protein